jgi:SpoVK/Ycf46/Vps4 family AAA+-type ATPase
MDKRRARPRGTATTFFTGRTVVLRRLSDFFEKRESNTGPRREFLIHGMGGAGKTQIALKFAQNCQSEERLDVRVL